MSWQVKEATRKGIRVQVVIEDPDTRKRETLVHEKHPSQSAAQWLANIKMVVKARVDLLNEWDGVPQEDITAQVATP